MSNYQTQMMEERRWRILDFIQLVPARSLNTDVLRSLFRQYGFPVDAVALEADIEHLERRHCVLTQRYGLGGGRHLIVVTLTPEGMQVYLGERVVDGVAARRPL